MNFNLREPLKIQFKAIKQKKDKKMDDDSKTAENLDEQLRQDVRNNNILEIERLIQAGANVNRKDQHGIIHLFIGQLKAVIWRLF